MSTSLTEFLLARIAEDEAVARATYPHGPIWEDSEDYDGMAQNEEWWRLQVHTSECGYRMGEFSEPCACDYPARVLAECESKRRIVNLDEMDGGADDGYLHALRCLASVYVEHPDFDPAWRD